MNFLIDVHLPISLSKFLNNQNCCTATHVNQILQKWNTSDSEISKYADNNGLVVITKDEDFKSSHFVNKTPKKLIRVTLGNISNSDLILLFTQHLAIILPLSLKDVFYIEISKERITYNDYNN